MCVGTASIFDGKWGIAFKAAGYRYRSLGCWIAWAIFAPDKEIEASRSCVGTGPRASMYWDGGFIAKVASE